MPPVSEVEDSLTHKPLAIGQAECENEKGANATYTIYCGREDWEDATKCANAGNTPVLKSLAIIPFPSEKAPEKKEKSE